MLVFADNAAFGDFAHPRKNEVGQIAREHCSKGVDQPWFLSFGGDEHLPSDGSHQVAEDAEYQGYTNPPIVEVVF